MGYKSFFLLIIIAKLKPIKLLRLIENYKIVFNIYINEHACNIRDAIEKQI